MSNKAAFLETERGLIVVRDAGVARPGNGEVLIKVTHHPASEGRTSKKMLIGIGPSMRHSAGGCKGGQTSHADSRISYRSRQSRRRHCCVFGSERQQSDGWTTGRVWDQDLYSQEAKIWRSPAVCSGR